MALHCQTCAVRASAQLRGPKLLLGKLAESVTKQSHEHGFFLADKNELAADLHVDVSDGINQMVC
jgi:hypothetical protein